MNTLEHRISRREEAITSLHKIEHYREILKKVDFIEEYTFYEALLRREQARVLFMAGELEE